MKIIGSSNSRVEKAYMVDITFVVEHKYINAVYWAVMDTPAEVFSGGTFGDLCNIVILGIGEKDMVALTLTTHIRCLRRIANHVTYTISNDRRLLLLYYGSDHHVLQKLHYNIH